MRIVALLLLLSACYVSHPLGGTDADPRVDTAIPFDSAHMDSTRAFDSAPPFDSSPSFDASAPDAFDVGPFVDVGTDGGGPDVGIDAGIDAGTDAGNDAGTCFAPGRDEFGQCAVGCVPLCFGVGECCPCDCEDTVRLEAAEYWRGSPEAEAGRDDDEVRHRVQITRPFMVDRNETTQRRWREVMGSSPSSFSGCDECPVETINFYEALLYANARSAADGLEACYMLDDCDHPSVGAGCPDDGRAWRRCRGIACSFTETPPQMCTGWRLPTEAEWEYAARAGSESPFPGGDGLERANVYGWCGDSGGMTHPVGGKPSNPWGLNDIFGNVYEWTRDGYAPYDTRIQPLVDPMTPRGSPTVMRGGSWAFGDSYCRAANRAARDPSSRENVVGVRLVRTL